VFVSCVGDTAAYRVSQGVVETLTCPQDRIASFYHQRGISSEAAQHRFVSSIFYGLGWELPDEIEVPSFTPREGDRLILATDGVHRLLGHPELLAACQLPGGALVCAEHLVQIALDACSRDNATCVVLAFDQLTRPEATPPEPTPARRMRRKWWRFWT
jgi:serine/threonine protein phosphatase PrpC